MMQELHFVRLLHEAQLKHFSRKEHAEYLNRRAKREGLDETIEPLYDERDVQAALGQFVAVPYRRPFVAAPGVEAQFLDAGHVLGSSVTVVDVDDGRRTRRLAFTGDLGRRHMPILKDPEVPERAEILITESTYGNRLHDPIDDGRDPQGAKFPGFVSFADLHAPDWVRMERTVA